MTNPQSILPETPKRWPIGWRIVAYAVLFALAVLAIWLIDRRVDELAR